MEMGTEASPASSMFLQQYGEIDQQGQYDFRHLLPVPMVVDTKTTGKEGVAAQPWIGMATLKQFRRTKSTYTETGPAASVYNPMLQYIGYLRERK